MSSRNWSEQRKSNLKYTTKTASATLTKQELDHGFIAANHASSGVTFTLPAASTLYKGCLSYIVNKGAAAAKIYVAAGFGGAGGSYDTVTLAQGDGYIVCSDGSYWYDIGFATAASS